MLEADAIEGKLMELDAVDGPLYEPEPKEQKRTGTVWVESLGVVVPGAMTRKYDATTDATTLTITSEQAGQLHAALGRMLSFLASEAAG